MGGIPDIPAGYSNIHIRVLMAEILENVSLRNLNTFGIESKARYFARPKTRDELISLLQHRHTGGLQKRVLGGGSNLLITGDVDVADGWRCAVDASVSSLADTEASGGCPSLRLAAMFGTAGRIGPAAGRSAGAAVPDAKVRTEGTG